MRCLSPRSGWPRRPATSNPRRSTASRSTANRCGSSRWIGSTRRADPRPRRSHPGPARLAREIDAPGRLIVFLFQKDFQGSRIKDLIRMKDQAGALVVTLLDVRPVEEYRAAHVPGAVSLPLKELAKRLGNLPKGCEIVALLFGASMRWAGGCAAGVWYKLGAGDVGALLAIPGTVCSCSAS